MSTYIQLHRADRLPARQTVKSPTLLSVFELEEDEGKRRKCPIDFL